VSMLMAKARATAGHHRGDALAAIAVVDDALQDAIKSRLVALNTDQDKELFSDGVNGPLSTFSNKIKFGYALGLYGKLLRADLDCLRHIRNAFAHAKLDVDFKTKEISDACSLFHYSHVMWKEEMVTEAIIADPARRFFAIAALLVYRLQFLGHPVEPYAALATGWSCF
jgi:DNA-binding MltR family transcriptional regulator